MDVNTLLKEAKKVQYALMSKEAELNRKSYDVSVHDGAVKVCVTGHGVFESISIKEEMLEKGNKEVLDDMVLMAVNQALIQMNEDRARVMEEVTGEGKLTGDLANVSQEI